MPERTESAIGIPEVGRSSPRCVISRHAARGAQCRRYLKPECKRRRSWASARTRYLKPVHAAVLADIGDFPWSADTRSLATEGDEGTGGKVAGSDAISAGYLCLQSGDPRSPVASRPGAQGRPRPEHRKRRGSSALPSCRERYRERRTVHGRRIWTVSQPGSRRPCTRSAVDADLSAVTCPRRKSPSPPALLPDGLQITALPASAGDRKRVLGDSAESEGI